MSTKVLLEWEALNILKYLPREQPQRSSSMAGNGCFESEQSQVVGRRSHRRQWLVNYYI